LLVIGFVFELLVLTTLPARFGHYQTAMAVFKKKPETLETVHSCKIYFRLRERMSPGGFRGLQIRWGAINLSSVGSTPMRSRQKCATRYMSSFNLISKITVFSLSAAGKLQSISGGREWHKSLMAALRDPAQYFSPGGKAAVLISAAVGRVQLSFHPGCKNFEVEICHNLPAPPPDLL
jgi:hypothetical protein